MAKQLDAAPVVGQQSQQSQHQAALASTIRSDQGRVRAGVQFKADPVHHQGISAPNTQIRDSQHRPAQG